MNKISKELIRIAKDINALDKNPTFYDKNFANEYGQYENFNGTIDYGFNGNEVYGKMSNAKFGLVFPQSNAPIMICGIGTWEKGEAQNVYFGKKCIIKNGKFSNCYFQGSTFENGKAVNCVWDYGTWKSGTWKSGNWWDGIWENGKWEDGWWKTGTWKGGTWIKGTWEGGYDKNGNYHEKGDSPDKWQL